MMGVAAMGFVENGATNFKLSSCDVASRTEVISKAFLWSCTDGTGIPNLDGTYTASGVISSNNNDAYGIFIYFGKVTAGTCVPIEQTVSTSLASYTGNAKHQYKLVTATATPNSNCFVFMIVNNNVVQDASVTFSFQVRRHLSSAEANSSKAFVANSSEGFIAV